MDWLPTELEPDLSTPGHASPFQEGRTKTREEDHGEPIEQVRRAKMGDFDPVHKPEAEEGVSTSSLQTLEERKIESFVHQNEEEGTSKITEATTLMILDRLAHMPMDLNLPRSDVTVSKHGMEKNSCKDDLVARGVDLNDPFYPYKKLGQVGSTDTSECGSTTGLVEISESMRRWNEMKRNGFISTLQAKASIPGVRKHKHKKKNDVGLKKKIDTIRKDQSSMLSNVAAPVQLLSGLNPGIIKHVRNSKQVNSIIKAMLQNELLEKQETLRPTGEYKSGSKEEINGWKEHGYASAAGHLGLSLNNPLSSCSSKKEQLNCPDISKHRFNHESCNTSKFSSDFKDDALTLKLSSSVTMAPEHDSKTNNADFSLNQEEITSLSSEAASVALQWLELIQSDIMARLAALKRSKNRVKNAILKELPCLFSRDPKQGIERIEEEILDKHLVQWKALFNQMEESLTKEENQLDNWLGQVDELKSQCQEGLRYVYANGFSHLESIKDSRILKSREAYEKECAVRAAAASIYSTCNMIMTA